MIVHSIKQTEVNLNYTMTETKKEYSSLTRASSKQTWKDSSVQVELLQEYAEVSIVLHQVQQMKLFRMTMFSVGNLLLEEGNKCFELDKVWCLCMSNNLICTAGRLERRSQRSEAMPRCNET